MSTTEVLVVQTCVPDYRLSVFRMLHQSRPDVRVVSGMDYFTTGLDTSAVGESWWQPLTNRFLLGRRFAWQQGVIKRAIAAELVVAEWNPRLLSTWVFLGVRSLLGRRTLLWGHIVSRQPVWLRFSSQWLRERMAWLSDGILTYTKTDAQVLRGRLPGMPIWAAPNSNIVRSELGDGSWSAAPLDAVCIGRLIKAKKGILLLDAWIKVQARLPAEARLVFVGAGPERESLEQRARAAGVEKRVVFLGHITDRQKLGEIFQRALVCVSAGYIGLSAVQSLAHGVPLLLARGEPHSPEVEACVDGFSATFFEADRVASLAEALSRVYEDRVSWLGRREELIDFIRERYTVEAMVAGMEDALGYGRGARRAVLVWEQFGPYHLARLRAMKGTASGWQFMGLELATVSDTYRWERSVGAENVHCLESRRRPSDLHAVTVYRRALLFFLRTGADVVFVTSYWPQSSVAVLLAAKRAGAAVVVMTDSHAHTSRARGVSQFVKHRLIRSFDAGFLAGQPQIEFFAERGLPREKLFDGYDVVDNDYFCAGAKRHRGEAEKRLGRFGLPERYFLNIGRMVKKKNLPVLLAAYAMARSQVRDFPKLVLVGDGPERGRLRDQGVRAGLVIAEMDGVTELRTPANVEADVYFYGFRQVDQLPAFYSGALAFVLPSLWEEWGLVINEAMASSLPVVVSRVAGCVRDLVSEGVTGRSFDPENVEELAQILSRLSLDPELGVMGRAARQRIATWNLDRFARNARRAADAALGVTAAAPTSGGGESNG